MDFFQPSEDGSQRALQETFSRLFDNMQWPKVYARGNLIYLQGEPAEYFYYLQKGRVRIFLAGENGTEKTLTVLEPGSIFGEASFLGKMPRVSSAKALEKCRVISIDRSALTAGIQKDPSLALALLEYLSRKVEMLSAQLDSLSFLSADRRVAQILLRLSGFYHQTEGAAEHPLSVMVTHEELGEHTNLSRVSVSRALGKFTRLGWIETHYRKIFLRKPEELKRFSQTEEELPDSHI